MAARKRVKDLQAVANCSICRDYFKDPVILKCGHSFCRACITGYCEFGDFMDISPPSYPCPLCREVFGEGEFQPNRQLRNIVDIAKKISEPRGRRTCKEHGKILKLFCEVDGTPICLDCGESPAHKEHRVAPADEAALDYKAQIQSRLEILKKVREEILSFKLSGENESRELLKRLQTEKQMIMSEFQQLHPFREEQERLLLAQLEELNKEIEKRRDEYVAKLSEEISSFSSLISEMEQKCQQPASVFLQDIKVTLSRCEREKFQNPVAFSSDLKRRIWKSYKKNAALKTKMKKFKDQKETYLVHPWLRRRTTRLQDKLSRLSMGAKWASSEEDSDTDKKKSCPPIGSLSDSALSRRDLYSRIQELVKQASSKEDSDKDKKKRCLPIDSLSDSALSRRDLCSQFQEQDTLSSSEEDSDKGERVCVEQVLPDLPGPEGVWAADKLNCDLMNVPPVVLTGNPPPPAHPYPIKPEALTAVESTVKELIKRGVVKEIPSKCNSPVWPVKKPDGLWQLTIDYRNINMHADKLTLLVADLSVLFFLLYLTITVFHPWTLAMAFGLFLCTLTVNFDLHLLLKGSFTCLSQGFHNSPILFHRALADVLAKLPDMNCS